MSSPSPTPERPPHILHTLTNAEEEVLVEINDTEFQACTKTKTITLSWACKNELKRMNDCVSQYTSENDRDKGRAEMLEEKRKWREGRAAQEAAHVAGQKRSS
ncbi:hypothetical protein HK101_011161 [Irineochytrium annulatum]|nr:hypothetical protein HK101_011161 [Irineochytrium annulatum]